MVFYSSGGKYVADSKRRRRKRSAVNGRRYPLTSTQKEKKDAVHVQSAYQAASNSQTKQQTNGTKHNRRGEWLIWLKALLIFCTIMIATVLFLLVRKTRVTNEFRQLAEQIQQAEDRDKEQSLEAEPIETTEPTQSILGQTEASAERVLPKYAEIYEQNPDFFGWVCMEGTELDCPVMRSSDDDEKYLHANFYGDYSYAGTPFVDNNCTRDSDNILIYGHNLRDGSVFHSLLNYEKQSYWQEHPTIMFSDLYEDYEYEVMAAFYDRVYAREETEFRYYQFLDAASEEEYDYAIGKFKEKALYNTGVEAKYGDKLITLSTCAYHVENGRFVVVARRIG